MAWYEEFLTENNKNTISTKEDLFDIFEEVYQNILGRSEEPNNTLLEEDYKILDEFGSSFPHPGLLKEKVTKKQRKEAEKFLISLPSFVPTEAWGDPTTADRKTINRIFAVMGGGRSVEKKISFLQRIASPSSKISSPRRVIASLLILEALSTLVHAFNEASAGFVFEGWLAALLQGKQEAERTSEKGNLPIQDLIAFSELKEGGETVPVSLKLLGPNTDVEGSFTNLIDALFDEPDFGGRMNYIVARKSSSKKEDGSTSVDSITIESFDINQRNFIDLLTLTSGRMLDKKTRVKSGKQKKHGKEQFKFKSQYREAILANYSEITSRQDRGFETDSGVTVEDSTDDISILKAHLDDPDTLYHLLQHCAAYTGPVRDQQSTDINPDEPQDDEITSDQPPEEEELGYLQRRRKELGLTEARAASEGPTGWLISVKQVEFLSERGVIQLQNLGTLPANREQVINVALMHMDLVREKFQTLFKAFSLLSEDINKYITFPKRAAAMQAGERAIGHTETIQTQMAENIASDQDQKGDFISSDEV